MVGFILGGLQLHLLVLKHFAAFPDVPLDEPSIAPVGIETQAELMREMLQELPSIAPVGIETANPRERCISYMHLQLHLLVLKPKFTPKSTSCAKALQLHLLVLKLDLHPLL